MWQKIKNFSLGKKIYSSLWLMWSVFLIVLIALFTGMRSKMDEAIAPKDGWTVAYMEKNQINLTQYSNATKDEAKAIYDNADRGYEVKDIKKTNDTDVKTAIKTALGSSWEASWDALSLGQVINTIKALKNADGTPNQGEIDMMYGAIWSSTTFVNLDVARKSLSAKDLYDVSVAKYKNADGSFFNLMPRFDATSKAYYSVNPLKLGSWNTIPTADANKAKNATASVGFVWLSLTIAAVFTTVLVSIKEKGGKK